jgi:membrane-associated phospholipid phosphatase
MLAEPTQFDLHTAAAMARFLGKHPLFDHCVQSGIRHNLLGGIPFAATAFYFWVQGEREHRWDVLRRMITIILGSFVAITLALITGNALSWLPPQRQPGLEHLYPSYLLADPNTNSFPSDSTALFTSIAIGVLSLNRVAGAALLLAVPLLISLPRMYVGGHYPTDVLAGLLVGFVGYWLARVVLEHSLSIRILGTDHQVGWRRMLLETCVFLWILEVAVSFSEGVWIVHALQYFHMKLPVSL